MSKTAILRVLMCASLGGLLVLPAAADAATIRASANNMFVSAENAGAGFLIANRAAASAWEEFTVVNNSDGTVSLQAQINGRFVTTDLANGGRLIATQTAIGTNEKFQMVAQTGGTVAFRAMSNNLWVCADLNVTGTLIANRGAVSTWERFTVSGTPPGPGPGPGPDFGPNVRIFDPSMSQATIQSQVNSIYSQQQNAQFGSGRFAIMFKPGTYNVNIPVGFYTQILGLGALPDQVNITNQVHSDPILPNNNATQNFWRGVENFSVTPPGGGMQWAVSQAIPFRRMHVRNNNLVLHLNGGWTSGGWISDSLIDFDVNSGSQQQWISRNSQWGSWTGHVWNMVFVGIPNNLPGGTWPDTPNTFINPTPLSREKPFLIAQGSSYAVHVPSLRTNTSGITWASGQTPGTTIPIDQFHVARAGVDTAATINAALDQGRHILFTPGIYGINQTLRVTQPNTVVLGIGLATLRADNGVVAMTVADVDGVKLAGLLFDAGPTNSPLLLQVGPPGSSANHAGNPTSLHDVFARVGGAGPGKATVCVQINSSNVLIDHTWLWRADHGAGVGWDINTSRNGIVVNGANVTAYGLFVEHFQEYQVIWNGNGGRVFFYQSEIPYDPPNQNAWRSAAGVNGWASYKVANSVTSHEAHGLGVYSVFTFPNVFLSRAIEAPSNPNVRFNHMTTVNLTVNGGITRVINNTGDATLPGIAINTPQVTTFP
jgi:hypothetical protein